MAIRKLLVLGRGRNGAASYGVAIDKTELEYDGILERIEDDEEVQMNVQRIDEGVWQVEAL